MRCLTSCLLIMGISLIYGFVGSTNFALIMSYLSLIGFDWFCSFQLSLYTLFIQLGGLLIIVGLLFKLGIVPFHFWVADVYEGSPLIITFFFATVAKISIFYIFVKMYFCLYVVVNVINVCSSLFFICGVGSIIIGSLGAFYQEKLKRLIGYSSITTMGFLLISLSLMTLTGLFAAIFFLSSYILLITNLFLLLIIFERWPGGFIDNLVELFLQWK